MVLDWIAILLSIRMCLALIALPMKKHKSLKKALDYSKAYYINTL
jgi:hypothetical protein